MFAKGTILWVDLGMPPNEVVGHEQGKNRPCVVLADFSRLELLLIASMSTKPGLASWPTCVKVSSGEGGLTKEGCIMLHQMRTVAYGRVGDRIGKLSDETMGKVDAVLIDIHDL